ncbi:MAG: hypothetical protein Q9215_005311, partial [Flavoplaca cf. flavocitrina]
PNKDWSQLRPISQLRIKLLKNVLSQVSVHLLDRIRFPEQPGSVGLIVPGSDPATSSHKAIVLANALANVLDDDSHMVQALVDEPDVHNMHDQALLYSKENLLGFPKHGMATNRTNSIASGRRLHFSSYYSCGVRGPGTTSTACGSSTSSAPVLLEAGLTSAYRISQISEEALVNKLKSEINAATVKNIYAHASEISIRIHQAPISILILATAQGASLAALDGRQRLDERISKLKRVAATALPLIRLSILCVYNLRRDLMASARRSCATSYRVLAKLLAHMGPLQRQSSGRPKPSMTHYKTLG